MSPRVFISSVMDGFSVERETARRSILTAGCDPILIEDYPSLSKSPRDACLDAIQSCDSLILIIGERAGYVAPSGKPAVQEEVEYARFQRLPIFVFVSAGAHDSAAENLIAFITDYVDGLYRKVYASTADLQREVTSALRRHYEDREVEMFDMSFFETALAEAPTLRDEPSLRLVISPERRGTIFDPVAFESTEFKDRVFLPGYSTSPPLFDHETSKQFTFSADGFRVRQGSVDEYSQADNKVDMRVDEYGCVICDLDISGLRERGWMVHNLYVLEADVERRAKSFLMYWGALMSRADPYGRYRMWRLNAALLNMQMRRLLKNPPQGNSIELGTHGSDPMVAYHEPRKIERGNLIAPDDEVGRFVSMLRRRAR